VGEWKDTNHHQDVGGTQKRQVSGKKEEGGDGREILDRAVRKNKMGARVSELFYGR